MNKKIALALLLSTLYVGTVHVADRRHVQPGVFQPPYYAHLMGWAPEMVEPQSQETQLGQPNDSQSESQRWEEYCRCVDEYNRWVMLHNQERYRAHLVTAKASAQQTHTADFHPQSTTINCCVIGDNCCVYTSNDNDECSCDCPLSVTINPLVHAALNLFTCGAADANKDPNAQQLRALQERNPGMNSSALAGLLAAGPRVVTIEYQPKAHQE